MYSLVVDVLGLDLLEPKDLELEVLELGERYSPAQLAENHQDFFQIFI